MSDKWMRITDVVGMVVSVIAAAALWLRAIGVI